MESFDSFEEVLKAHQYIRFIDTQFFQLFCILLAIFGIGCLIACIVIFVINRITRVSVDNVPVIKGTFGVQPNKTGTVASKCGVDETLPCVSNASNVFDAIEYCKIYKGGCKGFVFDYANKQVKILDDAPIISDSTECDIYYRQVVFKN